MDFFVQVHILREIYCHMHISINKNVSQAAAIMSSIINGKNCEPFSLFN